MINFSLAPHSAGVFSLCFLVAELVCVPGCLCVFVCVGGRDFMFYMFQTSFQVSDFFFWTAYSFTWGSAFLIGTSFLI